ncbi:MAG: hypothetical protein IPJ61_18085 [Tessaracoccus sp.]|uniref:hypothetical protein n=1 Tax=Tessaracoccus sp. TaxID=1971211 RepID=UPI001ECB6984|nr:hypothetical protein [Tessaracoccus sp.]
MAGIPLYQSAAVRDELPLDLVGLEKWKVVTALVGSLRSGATLRSVIDRFQSREELPPGSSARSRSTRRRPTPSACGTRRGRGSSVRSRTTPSTSRWTSRPSAGYASSTPCAAAAAKP